MLWGTLFGVVGPIGNNCGAKSQDQAQTIVEDGTTYICTLAGDEARPQFS